MISLPSSTELLLPSLHTAHCQRLWSHKVIGKKEVRLPWVYSWPVESLPTFVMLVLVLWYLVILLKPQNHILFHLIDTKVDLVTQVWFYSTLLEPRGKQKTKNLIQKVRRSSSSCSLFLWLSLKANMMFHYKSKHRVFFLPQELKHGRLDNFYALKLT